MSRILWGVCGIGLGHARRSKLIAERIDAEIKFVSYGAGQKYLKCTKVEGYEYRGKESWSFLQNLFGIIKDFSKVKRSYDKIKRIATKFDPHLIVADTEPITVHYARRNNKPYVLISNLPLVIDNFDELPIRSAALRTQYELVKGIENYMESEAEFVIVPSFKRKKKSRRKLYCGPLAEAFEAARGDYIYVNVGGHDMERRVMEHVIKQLKKFDEKFVVASNYLYSKYTKIKNIEIYPFVKQPEKLIAASKGVITTAGLTIIHEAMVTGKPIAAIAIPNHIEQITNAYLVEKHGLGEGVMMEKLERKLISEVISYFVDSIDDYKVRKRESGLDLAASRIADFLRTL